MEKQARPGLTVLWYSLLRLGIFAAVLVILLVVMPTPPWVSTIVAAVIALCISFLVLGRPRAELAGQIDRMRNGKAAGVPSDDDAEDAAVDSPDRRS